MRRHAMVILMKYRIQSVGMALALIGAVVLGMSACGESGNQAEETTVSETIIVAETTPETTPETEPPHEHIEAVDAAVPPTCTETGLTEGKYCLDCGEILVAKKLVDALGHTEEVDAAVAPTCTETGLAEGKHCAECGEILVSQETVEASGHAYAEEWTNDAFAHWHAASCEHSDLFDEKAAHSFDENYCCTVCSYQATPTEGLAYTQSSDKKSYLVSGIGTATATDIVIPATYEDLPVTGIYTWAFYNCADLTSITLPVGMTSIGSSAFRDCVNLQNIVVPAGMASIGNQAFYDCDKLEGIYNLSSLTVSSEIPFTVVPYSENFDESQIHEGIDILYEASPDSPYANICIVVDAGHQAKSNLEKEPNAPGLAPTANKNSIGATGQFSGQLEKDLNLAVSLNLRNELVKRGYNVAMTRETDAVDYTIVERAESANALKEKYEKVFVIRIHANSFSNPSAKGALAAFQSSTSPYCKDTYAETAAFAESILKSFCAATGISRRSNIENDKYTTINWSQVPSFFLEMGFLSNEGDDRLMATDEFRKTAAVAIANGVDKYFG